ncbi:MAG: MogA/MoaB family molybdenum cofactor biosynthesis protein [Synergistaceae bacterium]|jgi:molybdenum cofactor synthesis domain-containing protein|nr:MogA/MoaB family molybdenum cofactor biosynthesis protein [Synergistaceae bacterium]
MRILRLYAPSLIGDHTLCYVHKNINGESFVNGTPLKIKLVYAGEKLKDKDKKDSLIIIVSRETELKDGDFLIFKEYGTLLRWDKKSELLKVKIPGFLSVSTKFTVWLPLCVALLTISDKGYRGERIDTSAPKLEELVLSQGGIVMERDLVPDDIEDIVERVKRWCDKGYNLILTTGGTGISARDNTPEALIQLADKTVPGFGEMMRMKTSRYSKHSFLTRGLAVVRDKTLIIALPGSEKGATECFNAISSGIRHSVEILAGLVVNCSNRD